MERPGENAAKSASDTMEKVKEGREAVGRGYENTREYLSKGLDYAGEVSDGLSEFVQRQPWLALAGAFVVGYVVAKALRHLSL